MDLVKAMVWPFVRYVLTYAAAWLVARGIFTDTEAASLVADGGAFVVTILVNLIFSYLEKVQQKKEVLVALKSPEDTPVKAVELIADASKLVTTSSGATAVVPK